MLWLGKVCIFVPSHGWLFPFSNRSLNKGCQCRNIIVWKFNKAVVNLSGLCIVTLPILANNKWNTVSVITKFRINIFLTAFPHYVNRRCNLLRIMFPSKCTYCCKWVVNTFLGCSMLWWNIDILSVYSGSTFMRPSIGGGALRMF